MVEVWPHLPPEAAFAKIWNGIGKLGELRMVSDIDGTLLFIV